MVKVNKDIVRFCLVAVILLHIIAYKLIYKPDFTNETADKIIKISMVNPAASNEAKVAEPPTSQNDIVDIPQMPIPRPLAQPVVEVTKPRKPDKTLLTKGEQPAKNMLENTAENEEENDLDYSFSSGLEEEKEFAQDFSGVNNSETTASENIAELPVVSKPSYRKSAAPEYPGRAVAMGYEGTVLVHALVGVGGKTEQVKIARSSGYNLLDEAALKAVKKWEFEPYRNNGQLMRSWVEVPVQFKLK